MGNGRKHLPENHKTPKNVINCFERQNIVIELRSERQEDFEGIRQVHESAFGRPNEAALVEMLRTANKAPIALVVVKDGQPVGHILFSPVTVADAPEGFRAVGLGPLAVLPAFQKMGAGSRLIRQGLLDCIRDGYDAVFVLGNPHYYSRFGFLRASDHQLDNEYHAYEEFMVIELKEDALQDVRGLVKYAPEFHSAGC
jgi:putative acetyltransferase